MVAQYAPTSCVPGSALSTNTNASSSGPRVTLVTTGEAIAARDTLYGLTPPVIVSAQGSQVLIVVVTLGRMTGGFLGAGGWQEVVFPANYNAQSFRQSSPEMRFGVTYCRHQRKSR